MSDAKPSKKEAVYNSEISPLMTRIIELCKQHDINLLATFSLDTEEDPDHEAFGNDLICTTAIIDPPGVGTTPKDSRNRLNAAFQIVRDGFTAFAVTTRPR